MNAIETLNLWGARFVDFALPMLVQSSLLIIVLFALDLLLRKRVRAVVRYTFWMLLLVKLLLPPSLALPTGLGYWLATTRSSSPPPSTGFVVSYRESPRELLTMYETFTGPKPSPRLKRDGWLLLIWLVGTLSLLGYVAYRNILIRRQTSAAKEAPPELKRLLIECCGQVGIRRPIRLAITEKSLSPAVCGLWRPVILVPRQLADRLSALQSRAVLLHELGHVKRGDVWVNYAQTLLQVFYWWHPLLWFAHARIRRVREEVVDEAVAVAMGCDAETYPATLLEVAKLALARPVLSLGFIGIMESRSALSQRIQRLLNQPVPKSAKLNFTGLLAVVLCGALLLPTARGQRRTPDRGVDNTAEKTDPSKVVMISIKYLAVPDSALELLALGTPSSIGTNGHRAWILSGEQTTNLLAKTEGLLGTDILSGPRISTLSGRQAVASVTQTKEIGGRSVAMGPVCEVLPRVAGKNVELALHATLTEAIKVLSPDALAVATAITNDLGTASVTVRDHGWVVVQNPKARDSQGKSLLLLISPTIVESEQKQAANEKDERQRSTPTTKTTNEVVSAEAEQKTLVESTQAAISNLKKGLESEDGEARRAALVQFAFSPQTVTEAENPILSEALPILVAATKDKNDGVRSFAIDGLRNIKSTRAEAIKALCALMLNDKKVGIATSAASTLKEMGPAAAPAVPSLIETLQGRRDDGTFVSPADGQIEPDISSGTSLRRAVLEALGNIGPAAKNAVPILRERLKDNGEFSLGNRVFSAKALWQITGKTDESLPVLASALKNDDSFWAADILGLMGPEAKSAIPDLQSAFQSRLGYTRLRAAVALNKIDPHFPLPLPLLLELLNDPNSSTRFETAAVLWKIKQDPPVILPTLLRLIESEADGHYGHYQEKAIALLGEIGPPAKDAIPALKILAESPPQRWSLRTPRWNTRSLAAEALKRIEAKPEANLQEAPAKNR